MAIAAPTYAAAQVAARSVAVEAMTLEPTLVVESVSAVGALTSEASVVIRPEIPGRIREVGYIEGSTIQAGDVVVRLDDAIFRAELDQAQARRDLSRRTYERTSTLAKKGHSSAQTLDITREEVRVNDASVELARARLQKTIIVAPFDGVVGLSAVSVGDYVEAGDEIVNIEKIVPLKVDFRLPERYLRLVGVGRPIEIELDAFPGEVHRGEVYAIDPRIREGDRSVAIRARLPNADGRLRPGLFARIRLIVDRRKTAIVVPEEALMPRGDRRFVFRIIDDKVALTEVKVGMRETGRVEIVEGLVAGETIVTAGHAKVRDGGAVHTIAPTETGTATSSGPGS